MEEPTFKSMMALDNVVREVNRMRASHVEGRGSDVTKLEALLSIAYEPSRVALAKLIIQKGWKVREISAAEMAVERQVRLTKSR